jgi:predicted nucleotidyltransferase/HEPN domain-containing protein
MSHVRRRPPPAPTPTLRGVKRALLVLPEKQLKQAEGIAVFGSLARGYDWHEHSDIDIVVVVKKRRGPHGIKTVNLWYQRIRDALSHYYRDVTVLVYTVEIIKAVPSEVNLPLKQYVIVVHYAQLALECAAKVVIGYYHEPRWTHDPSDELSNVISTHGKKLERRLNKTTMRALRQLALDARAYAQWHIWATYGSHDADGAYHSLDELCTPEVAADLMPRARRAVALASRFVQAIS